MTKFIYIQDEKVLINCSQMVRASCSDWSGKYSIFLHMAGRSADKEVFYIEETERNADFKKIVDGLGVIKL